jgi:hypothetical protein
MGETIKVISIVESMIDPICDCITKYYRDGEKTTLVSITDNTAAVKPIKKINKSKLPKERLNFIFNEKFDDLTRKLAIEDGVRKLLSFITCKKLHDRKKFIFSIKEKRDTVHIDVFMIDSNSTIDL